MSKFSFNQILSLIVMIALIAFGLQAVGEKYGVATVAGIAALLWVANAPRASHKLGANLSQNQNQTFQTPMLAQVTMDPQPNTVSAQIYPSSTAAVICAGCAVKLVATIGSQIIVDATTGPTDGPVYGIIPYNMRKNSYSPSDIVEVVGKNGILMLKTYAAVPRGARVVVRNPAASSSDPMVESSLAVGSHLAGVALGQAAAGSSLIKVQVDPAYVQSTGVITVSN